MPFTALRTTRSGSRPSRSRGLGTDAAGIAGVAPVLLLLGALRGADVELGGVHHDHVVAGVDVGRADRLVLAPQQPGDLGRHAAEHDAVGVDDVPGPLDVAGWG